MGYVSIVAHIQAQLVDYRHVAGHTRPMCTLAARLVQLESVTVTFFVAASLYERIKAEVARDFDMGAQDPRLSGLR